ncbi:UDP-N-acetylmuramate dehydrogenase [Pseudoclavibacter soli]|uniref:UDP-N-acetylmuramate dehydrogenase n=1 Tax=Pseudoclavibacter soli TaxID=452623 RepID=UPI00042A5A6C|nr:UDP-N-acetylmuramate dehydrogenase [Pseudoclavibacter soli]
MSAAGEFRFAEHTTVGVGGAAAEAQIIESTDDLTRALDAHVHVSDELLVVGGGSNLVVADEGFDGTVLVMRNRGLHAVHAEDGSVLLHVAAGEPWDDLVAHTVAQGWGGIESLSGIPGRAGAAVIQNIGAYGHDLAETLVSVDIVDVVTAKPATLAAAVLGLGYRTSAFKRGELEAVVTGITLRLSADGQSAPVQYAQLAEALGVPAGDRAPVAEVRETVLRLRRGKGMVYDPSDVDTHGCGSFFTNPVVHERFAAALPADAPRWPVDVSRAETPATAIPLEQYHGDELQPAAQRQPALVKLSAGWLIEHAGVPKGFALPGSRAAVSSKHTLAITNRGGASAREIIELAGFIQTRVANEFGVALQPEPNLVGFVEN